MSVLVRRIIGESAPEFELTSEWLNRPFDPTCRDSIDAAVGAALAEPLGLPEIARCVTPDDSVALAVSESTPAAPRVVAAVVSRLVASGVSADRITAVTADRSMFLTLENATERIEGVTIELHDPDDDEVLCFDGLTRTERPLLVNRRLFEADLVIPITGDGELGSPYGGIFPEFFDRKTIQRVTRVSTVASSRGQAGRVAARRREAEEAGWMLGTPLMIRAVSGRGGQLAGVVAGNPPDVWRQSETILKAEWLDPEHESPGLESADLVIAKLGGESAEQSWAALGRAIDAAERLAQPGGVLAVWSELERPIGPALGRLVGAEDRDKIVADLARESGHEAYFAWRLAQVLERGPVFMRSRLPSDSVEELGMAPIESADQLVRLAGRYESCIVIEDAQHARLGFDHHAAEVGE